MKYILIIPLLGLLTYLTISAAADKKDVRGSQRSKRSFGFSNPIFSRVFNPYDTRPLAEKFFGYEDSPAPIQERGPQFYPLWNSQPILNDGDSEEDYPRRDIPGYIPLSWRFERPHPEATKPYPPPAKPHPTTSRPYPAHSTPCPEPVRPHVVSTTPSYLQPYPAPSKPYPAPSKPYPAPSRPSPTSKPCPEPTKPYPVSTTPLPFKPCPETSKPYPAPSKPYPAPSKPYPAPSKPSPTTSKPCPEPTTPYPASTTPSSWKPCLGHQKPHQTSWKPVVGRIFVDEVDKTLHFEKDPETGELVPVITSGRTNHQSGRKFKTHEPTEESYPTTTAVSYEEPETVYDFKLLPNYDIQTRFNSSKATKKTSLFDQIKHLPLEQKIFIIEQEQKRREKERIQWKLESQRKFEEAKKQVLRGIYGEDESKWPARHSESAVKVNEKPEEVKESEKPTSSLGIMTRYSFKKFVNEDKVTKTTTTIRPYYGLPNQENQKEPHKGPCRHKTNQQEKTPCSQKNNRNRFVQLLVYTEKPPQVNLPIKFETTTKHPYFYDVIVPHSTKNTADYSQFLAPPSAVIYQKFKKLPSSAVGSSKTSSFPALSQPTGEVGISFESLSRPSIIFQEPVRKDVSPQSSRSLEFRVFNNKLDQSVLDSLKNGGNGQIDTSKLDELTKSVLVEPVNLRDHNVRKGLRTLESSAKTFDFGFLDIDDDKEETSTPFETYGLPSRNFGTAEVNSTFNFLRRNGTQNYFNIGDIPLEEHKIWDGNDRVLINSYGEKTTTV